MAGQREKRTISALMWVRVIIFAKCIFTTRAGALFVCVITRGNFELFELPSFYAENKVDLIATARELYERPITICAYFAISNAAPRAGD